MAEIPQLNQTTGLEYTSPVQIASVEQAGFTGQQIQRTGNAVMELGSDIAEVNKRKEAVKRNLDAATDHQDALTLALQTRDDVLRDPSIAPSQYSKEFSSRYEKAIAPIRKRRIDSDALVAQASSNELSEVKNKFVADLGNLGIVEGSAQTVKQIGSLSSKGSAIAFQDSNQIDSQIILFDKAVDTIANTEFYDPKTALKTRGEGSSEIVRGGIVGEVSRNKFDTAGNLLKKYAPYLDVQKVQELETYIRQNQARFTEDQIKQLDRLDKYNKKVLTETQDKNFSSMAQLVLSAKDDATKQKLFADARAMVAKKQLQADGDGSYNTLLKLDKDSKGENDGSWTYQFTEKLTGDSDLSALRKEVISDVHNNKVGHKDGTAALKAIDAYERRVQSDPIYRTKFETTKQRIWQAFGTVNPYFPNMFPKQSRDARDSLMRSWLNVISKNPSIEPAIAADIVMKKQFGKLPVTIPGLSVSESQDVQSIDQGLSRLRNKFQNKEITKQQYLDALSKSRSQKEYLKFQGVK